MESKPCQKGMNCIGLGYRASKGVPSANGLDKIERGILALKSVLSYYFFKFECQVTNSQKKKEKKSIYSRVCTDTY